MVVPVAGSGSGNDKFSDFYIFFIPTLLFISETKSKLRRKLLLELTSYAPRIGALAVKHFAMKDWVDFVRGVLPEEQNTAMQKHLDSGCPDCRKTVESWRHVLDCAHRASSLHPEMEGFLASKYLN